MYLTIRNLPAYVRNANNRPRLVLLATLPIVNDSNSIFRSKVFYKYFRILFDLVIKASDREGIDIAYIDS